VQPSNEVCEAVQVDQSPMHLFRADLVGDGREVQLHALRLGILNEVKRALDD